jgi:hypothetical protein
MELQWVMHLHSTRHMHARIPLLACQCVRVSPMVLLYPLVLTRLALAEAGSSFLVAVRASCRSICAAQTGLLQAQSSPAPAACTKTGLVELSAPLALSTDGLSIDLQRRHTIERSS